MMFMLFGSGLGEVNGTEENLIGLFWVFVVVAGVRGEEEVWVFLFLWKKEDEEVVGSNLGLSWLVEGGSGGW